MNYRVWRHRAHHAAVLGLLASALPAYAQSGPPSGTERVSGQILALEDAVARAVAASPQGAASAARIDTLSAARAAADTRPAASVDVMAENLGVGGDELRRQFQITGTYNQRIERGGKRAARIGVADADIDVARADGLIRRLDIAAAVQRLYVEVQAAEAMVGIARERVSIAEQLSREVGRRVAEARDPLFAGTRARTQLAEARVDLELAEHARDAAMTRLALLWGGPSTGLSVSRGAFTNVSQAAGAAEPAGVDLAIYEIRRRRAAAELTLQRAATRTDPTLSAGPRYIGTGDVALVAGVSLPLANRGLNRANIARAEAEARQIEADLAVDTFQRRQQIALAAEKVTETAHEVEAIRDQVVPGAQRTLAEVRSGYNRGGFTFLDVSTAQTALHEARASMVRAATRHHGARVELDRLTGRFAPLVQEAR
ncbi:cobalt-zinc-cadmium efflux system outer membrane protein [Polymorphobacter multimanifer]|uniref:Cobalt-zinc-cadmium efflux system outer membrane protein n=1 Tax=Polymorphobacter multimanifer TaxID=1070431 RepID=A0A841LAP6_9SPHN|nr:TolC family protein [Polymorphobacter multimanifer]MBB6229206.1 cobalt-zinc-cadmium efflux system outer membrane protein [Polymorphobacter multimanifer]